MPVLPLFLGAVLAACAVSASAAPLADVSIHDRRDGRELAQHWHEGRRYVVGEPGREYEIRLRNRSARRVLAVTSVDGVNVLSGDEAAPAQSGYVIDARGELRIEGWRKSLSQVAAFYFTALPDSYAARTGRPHNVGVIGVALFRERAPCCTGWRERAEAPAPAAEAESRAGARADADAAAPLAKKSERLGTGHGERLDSAAHEVAFERASEQPETLIEIWYDRRENLVAQGILPAPPRYARHRPEAFPAARGFVPDP